MEAVGGRAGVSLRSRMRRGRLGNRFRQQGARHRNRPWFDNTPETKAVGVSLIEGPAANVIRTTSFSIAPGESAEDSNGPFTSLELLQVRGVFDKSVYGLNLESLSALAIDAYLNPEWQVEDIQQSDPHTWYRTYLPRVLKA